MWSSIWRPIRRRTAGRSRPATIPAGSRRRPSARPIWPRSACARSSRASRRQSLNVPADKIDFADGKVFARDNPDNALSLHRVAGQAHWSPASLPDGMAPALRESVTWSAPELTPTTASDEINTSLAYGFGFDFCGIEIDRDTGEIRVDKYVTSHDCGTILNPGPGGRADPRLVRRGDRRRAVRGIRLCARTAASCPAPSPTTWSPRRPKCRRLEILHPVQSPSPFTRLGAKGIAEGNQYSTPVCLANAVADALGRSDITVPLKPAKILEWMAAEEAPSRTQPAARPQTRGRRGITRRGVGGSCAASPQAVWSALLDETKLRQAIPGCERLERVGENAFKAAVDARRRPGARTVRRRCRLVATSIRRARPCCRARCRVRSAPHRALAASRWRRRARVAASTIATTSISPAGLR